MRRKVPAFAKIDWDALIGKIVAGEITEVPKPPFMTKEQMLNETVAAAHYRGIELDLHIMLGHIDIKGWSWPMCRSCSSGEHNLCDGCECKYCAENLDISKVK